MKNVIYYFTGSGNSLSIAKKLGKSFEKVDIVRVTKHNEGGLNATGYDTVGFSFPIYFSGIPMMLRTFVKNLKLDKEAYVYGIGNFGDKVDVGMQQLEAVLKEKGHELKGNFELTMPGNYVIMFDLDSNEKMEKNLMEEKLRTTAIGLKIMEKERIPMPKISFGTKLKGALVYRIFKPEKMDKNFWSDGNCNGCGICKKVCPAENISMVQNKPKWNHQCEQCLGCMHLCPKKSIQYRKGTVKRGRYKHPDVSLKELVVDDEM